MKFNKLIEQYIIEFTDRQLKAIRVEAEAIKKVDLRGETAPYPMSHVEKVLQEIDKKINSWNIDDIEKSEAKKIFLNVIFGSDESIEVIDGEEVKNQLELLVKKLETASAEESDDIYTQLQNLKPSKTYTFPE